MGVLTSSIFLPSATTNTEDDKMTAGGLTCSTVREVRCLPSSHPTLKTSIILKLELSRFQKILGGGGMAWD